ncbi:hypothetical protein D0862_10339 [Hortaea werneckii]|uniref:DUF6594 domain-containing protein n=1 Tax=Hortaea werneckii TaxID=91943 RepID=A0A3M7FJ85_HORWE|nr:hypothetical protein D0862_10339 [Hortaea werneckii]
MELQGCRPAGADELSFFAMTLSLFAANFHVGKCSDAFLAALLQATVTRNRPMEMAEPTAPKDPESQGDQPRLVTPEEYLPGFEEVAAFISTENEGGMYRRFRRLAARNLLYMQSELASLEEKLHRMDQGDMRKIDTPEGVNAFQCAIDWDALRRLEPTDDKAAERLALIMDIRKLMREYRMSSVFSKFLSYQPIWKVFLKLSKADDIKRRQFALTKEQHHCEHPPRHTSPLFEISWNPGETGQSVFLDDLWKKLSRKNML